LARIGMDGAILLLGALRLALRGTLLAALDGRSMPRRHSRWAKEGVDD
jgi:hypothetical protein